MLLNMSQALEDRGVLAAWALVVLRLRGFLDMAVQGEKPGVALAAGAEKRLVLLFKGVLLEFPGRLERSVAVLGGAGVIGGICDLEMRFDPAKMRLSVRVIKKNAHPPDPTATKGAESSSGYGCAAVSPLTHPGAG